MNYKTSIDPDYRVVFHKTGFDWHEPEKGMRKANEPKEDDDKGERHEPR